MSRTSRKSRFVRHLAAALLLALPGAALRAEPHIDPALAPLLQNPAAPIPAAVSRPGLTRRGDRRIQGEPTLDLFLRTTASRASLEAMGLRVRTLRGGRATATVPVSALAALAARPDVQLITVSRPLRPQLDKSVPQTGATWLRTESAGSFTGRTGDGVLIGFIDSGIDYDHPDFLDASGNSRVLAIWDQQTTGTAPAAFGYGNECTQTDILAGTCSEVDDADREGHGTHVAGIAAGSGAAPDASGATYLTTGMAPGASIAVGKTDFTVNGTIDGLTYLFDLADSLDLPAVVNISLGTHLGAHGGTHPIEQEIDALVGAAPGRAVVVAAGNYAATPIHAEVHAVAATSIVSPTFEVPRYTRTSGTDEVEITGYYPATDNLTVHLWSPSGLHYVKALSSFAGLIGCVRDATGAVVKMKACGICGTDLHMVRGTMPGMKSGTILGHETVADAIAGGIDAASVGKPDIEQDHIRLGTPALGDGVRFAFGLADDLHAGSQIEDGAESDPDDFVVVDNQQAKGRGFCFSGHADLLSGGRWGQRCRGPARCRSAGTSTNTPPPA